MPPVITDPRRIALQGVSCECGSHAWGILNLGMVTLVSPQDAHLLKEHVMSAIKGHRTFYVAFKVKRKTHYLHCAIMRRRKVDHRNRNGLDNQRPNLRRATPSQNQANRTKISNSPWPYKGIRQRSWGTWTAQIGVKKRILHLGSFDEAEKAARAYDAAAKKYYGKFAVLNFPENRNVV